MRERTISLWATDVEMICSYVVTPWRYAGWGKQIETQHGSIGRLQRQWDGIGSTVSYAFWCSNGCGISLSLANTSRSTQTNRWDVPKLGENGRLAWRCGHEHQSSDGSRRISRIRNRRRNRRRRRIRRRCSQIHRRSCRTLGWR